MGSLVAISSEVTEFLTVPFFDGQKRSYFVPVWRTSSLALYVPC